MPRFLALLIFFAALGPATWGIELATRPGEQKLVTIREARVGEAERHVLTSFQRIQDEMQAVAERVARETVVREALEVADDTVVPEPVRVDLQEAVIAWMGGIDVPDRTAVELYTADQTLLAWNGFSVESAWPKATVPAGLQTMIAEDDFRRVLAVWMPVQGPDGQIGAVRVVRLLRVTVPAPTPYIRNYDVDYRWRLDTDLPLVAAFGVNLRPGERAEGESVTLMRGIDGTLLGYLRVPVPAAMDVLDDRYTRFRNVRSFWWTLALGWGFAGLFVYVRRWARQRAPMVELAAYAGLAVLGWGGRFALLALGVPDRWFGPASPVAFLFEESDMQSTFAAGAVATVGDLFVSALFAFATAVLAAYALRRYILRTGTSKAGRSRSAAAARVLIGGIGLFLVILAHAVTTRHVMLDASLDFFAWTGFAPERRVLIVFVTLLLNTVSALIWSIALVGLAAFDNDQLDKRAGLLAMGLAVALTATVPGINLWLPVWVMVVYLAAAGAYVASQLVRFPRRAFWLRSMLLLTLVNTLLLYILAFRAMDEQRRLRVLDAATAFASNGDEQLVEVTKRTLSRLVSDPAVQTVIEGAPSAEPIAWPQDRNWIEGVPVVLPATYRIDMALFDAEGLLIDTRSFGRQDDVLEAMGDAYVRTQRAYASLASSRPSALIRPAPVTDTDASAFEGLAPVGEAGWALVRVEQELASYANAQLRGYATEENQLALAEFENGRLRRSAGKPFDRVRLPADVRRRLTETDEFWRTEDLHGDQYATYYRRFTARPEAGTPGAFLNVGKQVVVAARTRGIIPYDHLYYILRIAIAGLWLGGIVYVISFLVRRQHPRPAERFSFGERVQRSFLTVGVVAIFLMGFIGQQVIVRENRGAIQSRLERRLERVENILRLNARPGEALVDALNRIPIDDLSEQLSLELNVYDGAKLIATTRTPDETRRLVDRRLPVEAFEAVYLDGYERAFVRTDVQRGYSYTIGYRAFSNDRGEPERVIAVLTIPEQERIREERNRTTAYLFGALLLLLLVVLGTATVLANALSGPLMRLRGSMKRLGKGEYTGTLPVESRDEIGELTEAFNEMQGQLAESRRQLAQQERELAWREMARQVAHEIKNPLTPMKLSIQHLQRAYPAVSGDGGVGERGEAGRFDGLFQRITKTLIEQIDTLARIANEFSTFARLPRRMVEPLDLNEVIGEAIALQAGEAHVDIVPELASEPLVVEGDKEELRRAFINLIKNALQAMPAGGTVTVRTRLEGETAHAEVEDTGTGIPEEVRGKIFQPNFSTKTSGMGLGLALVKKTVDAMNGEIGFSTEEGRGTTFWMHFPVLRQEPVI